MNIKYNSKKIQKGDFVMKQMKKMYIIATHQI